MIRVMAGFESNPPPVLSVVLPVFNEGENLSALLGRIRPVLAGLDLSCEIVFVDDGSSDDTGEQIARFAVDDARIRLVQLSRNFGHQAALVAGLRHARGKAVITMDADLQHPPELIPQLVERWQAGHEIVQTVRREPVDVSALKRTGSRGFYRLLSMLTRLNVTPGATDFRLMSRPALDAFLAFGERCRFNRGLVHWIGFRYVEVPYDAQPRHAGRTKYSYRTMLRLAGDAVFSFSSWPLRLAGLAGALITLPAGVYLLFVLWARFFSPERVEPGWSSILATVLILGGVNLLVLWILGEYVGRMYEEVKQRPIYIVRPSQLPTETTPDQTEAPAAEAHPPADRSIHARQH